jgi:outer membrane protein
MNFEPMYDGALATCSELVWQLGRLQPRLFLDLPASQDGRSGESWLLHSTSLAATLLVVLHCATCALAQSAPVSSDRPWHSPAERNIEADLREIPGSKFTIDSAKTYSLPELLDMAEAHNPATRDSRERARAQAAALGVARGELFPILGAVAVSETARQEILFGDRFNGQVLQTFQMELDLNYTLFDFGARTGRINAAKPQLLAANFVFNDTHRQVIYQVQQAYYRLLSSMGQEDAARASLSNAEAVQRAAEQRLAHGLATQPDVLEAERHCSG